MGSAVQQTGGRMGDQFNAMLLEADAGRFRLGGLEPHDDVPWNRLREQKNLLETIEAKVQTSAGGNRREFLAEDYTSVFAD